jgi:protein involved in polysaccharide export with SLBB domain
MKLQEAVRFSFLLLFASGMIFNCSAPPKTNSESTARRQEYAEMSTALPEYRLGFGDVIEVKFFNNERFNETVTVRPDGRITIQKIGDILVTGMAPSQLDSLITVNYAKFLRDPEVTIFVRQFGGYQVYVLGEVNLPGGYPIQRNMTIVQAVAAAGGPKESANLGSVMILRRGKQEEVNALRVNLNKAIKEVHHEKISENNLYVEAQDFIYVPKTFISNVTTFMQQIYAGLLPPLDIYLRALWWSGR